MRHKTPEAQLPIYWVPVLESLYRFVLPITQGPTIWASSEMKSSQEGYAGGLGLAEVSVLGVGRLCASGHLCFLNLRLNVPEREVAEANDESPSQRLHNEEDS